MAPLGMSQDGEVEELTIPEDLINNNKKGNM